MSTDDDYEPDDHSRYRYRTVSWEGEILRLRDEGYRISFQVLTPQVRNIDPREWFDWANFRNCELPGPAYLIADLLMTPSDPVPKPAVVSQPAVPDALDANVFLSLTASILIVDDTVFETLIHK